MNTRRRMINALYELMLERNFETISVQSILEKSDVSRTTFYRYFTDKYDLMNQFYIENVPLYNAMPEPFKKYI